MWWRSGKGRTAGSDPATGLVGPTSECGNTPNTRDGSTRQGKESEMGNIGGSSGGAYPPHDLRGQGGGNRDSHQLPNEGLSQAKYAEQMEHEEEEAAQGKRPGWIERFKRWFSERF